MSELSTNQLMERRATLIRTMAKGSVLICMRKSEWDKVDLNKSPILYLGLDISKHPPGIGIALTDPGLPSSNSKYDAIFTDPASYYYGDIDETKRILDIKHRNT